MFFLSWSDADPTRRLTNARIFWRELAGIPEPTDAGEMADEYQACRAAYEEQLEDRQPPPALARALNFLTREVTRRGIELPHPNWPIRDR